MCDEKENSKHNAIFFVGSTQAGKSSHIKLLTGNGGVRVGAADDTQSCTKEISEYKDKNNDVFIDTPGLQDSGDLSDQEIFHSIQSKLASMEVESIKILWFVRPSKVASKDVKVQAKFISKLAETVDGMNSSIWESVILIVKQPTIGTPFKRDIQGPIAAAKGSCNNDDIVTNYLSNNSFGYSCIEWLKNDKENDSIIEMEAQYDTKTLKKMKFYYENEIESLLTKEISKLNYFQIMFYQNQCKKCDLTCDKRFPPNNICHTNMKHSHFGEAKIDHDGTQYDCHASDNIIDSTEWRGKYTHGGSYRGCPDCGSKHVDARRYTSASWVSTWLCRTCGKELYAGDHFYHCCNCCERGGAGHYSEVVACSGMKCVDCATGKVKATFCSNCNKKYYQYKHIFSIPFFGTDEETQGCTKAYETVSRHGCCSAEVGSNEYCARMWDCCKSLSNSNGCKWHWDCCNKHTSSLEDKDREIYCCNQVCKHCDAKWGASKGCVESAHDFV